MHKLGVIVPYRNRDEQLRRFVREVPVYLKRQGIDFEIIVVEQMDEESFNRGALLNAGALQAIELGCDYLVFHDVDLIPRYVDYSYNDIPVELVGRVVDDSYEEAFKIDLKDKVITDDYFGGAVLFPTELFQKINGYSNLYAGWGFEDNDLLERCREAQIPLKCKSYRQYSGLEPSFTFNSENSFVRLPIPKLDLNKSLSILVNFRVGKLKFNEAEISDEGCIFSIPGYDVNLSYTNFGTYKFEVFDNEANSYSIHTEKMPVGLTSQAIIVFDEGKVTFYLNGVRVGSEICMEGRRFVAHSKSLYLGVADPNRDFKKSLRGGQVGEIAIFRKAFGQHEISTLFNESYLGLGKYEPFCWYSSRVVDFPFVPNLGTLKNLEDGYMEDVTVEPFNAVRDTYNLMIPWSRGGTFKCLPHKTNGSALGSWQSWETRINQRRYQDVEAFGTLKHYDGLSTVPIISKIIAEQRPSYWHVQVLFKRSIKKLK